MKRLVLSALAGGGLLLATSGAQAAFVLTLDDPARAGIEVTVTDGGVGDGAAAAGVISFVGAVGGGVWSGVQIDAAVSKPFTGPAPEVRITAINQSSGAGTLEIIAEDTGFTDTGLPIIVSLTNLAASAGTVSATGLVNSGAVGTVGPTGPNTALVSSFASGSPGTPFALGVRTNLTHTGGGTSNYNAAAIMAPIPGAVWLFGSALAGLGAAGWFRRRESATA
jgi:hypothetical protein